ncbi:MAG TPA: hypothetical protein VN962_19330 [Polyangia bacterium]|nr:hypothetical protein [Polyangia bacterium]
MATVMAVVPAETAAALGIAGSGTRAETVPCVAPVPPTRRLVWTSPTAAPVPRFTESAMMLWVVWTCTPVSASTATPSAMNGPLPVPRAPMSPPLTTMPPVCNRTLFVASTTKSLVLGLAFNAALTVWVSAGGADCRQPTEPKPKTAPAAHT